MPYFCGCFRAFLCGIFIYFNVASITPMCQYVGGRREWLSATQAVFIILGYIFPILSFSLGGGESSLCYESQICSILK